MRTRLFPVLLIALAGCQSGDRGPSEQLPYVLRVANGTTIRIGQRVTGASPGQVVEYASFHLPEGVSRAWVEIDRDGTAASFELWFDPEVTYSELIDYYRLLLGPPTSQFAKLVGECFVWENARVRFEVCRSREPGEHGLLIAHVWPIRPIDV